MRQAAYAAFISGIDDDVRPFSVDCVFEYSMADFVDDGSLQCVLRHPDGAGLLDAEAVEDPVEERLREVGVIEAFADLLASLNHAGAEHEPDFGDQ